MPTVKNWTQRRAGNEATLLPLSPFSEVFTAAAAAIILLSISQVHVNVLVLEARLQAELIYALRAIMTYMKAT